jgi:hypothetical protein
MPSLDWEVGGRIAAQFSIPPIAQHRATDFGSGQWDVDPVLSGHTKYMDNRFAELCARRRLFLSTAKE